MLNALKKNRPLLLILVCLALGVLVYLDNRKGSDDAAAPSARKQAAAGNVADKAAAPAEIDAAAPTSEGLQLRNPLASFDKSLLKDWVERPLFAPSRQRPPTVAGDKHPLSHRVADKRPPPSYDLLGILRDGDRAIALLRKKGDGTSFRVEVGDMIGGWRVAKMEPASVVLQREDGTSQTVPLVRE